MSCVPFAKLIQALCSVSPARDPHPPVPQHYHRDSYRPTSCPSAASLYHHFLKPSSALLCFAGYSGYDQGAASRGYTPNGEYDYPDYPDEGADYGSYGGVGQQEYEYTCAPATMNASAVRLL